MVSYKVNDFSFVFILCPERYVSEHAHLNANKIKSTSQWPGTKRVCLPSAR